MSVSKEGKCLYQLTFCIDGQPCYAEMVEKGARLGVLPKVTKPLHTFDGWGEVPTRMPAHDLMLDGHFTPQVFRAIFASGVVQYGMSEQVAGTPLTAPEDPVKKGYDFRGWQGYEGVMPGENVTFEAQFTPRTYCATYLIDGVFRFTFQACYGDPFPLLEPPCKKDHVFSGWSECPRTMPDHDVTITGSFTEKLYKLTRVVDGEVFSEEELPRGAEVDKKVKPVKEGYYFSGWRKLPAKMPAKDITVVASMYPARYRADFYINGTLYDTVYIPFGESIQTPRPPEKEGTLFGGWDDLPATMPAHDLKINGVLNAELYSLSFMVDGEELKRLNLPAGAPIPKDIEVPSKEGFAFCGWDNTPSAMPDHDLTLHAVYATVRARYLFLIDGEKYAEFDPEEGQQLVMPTPPSKGDIPFSGWTAMKPDPRTGVTVFSGTYQDTPQFSLTFLLRGRVLEHRKLSEGDPIVAPEVSSNEEFEFLGWGELPETMPAHDLTVQAAVHTLRHSLVFLIDGEPTYTMSLDAGEEISCPAVASRAGFTFGGWQDVPKTMPAHDLTVHGSYLRNRHTVTYMVEGETLHTAKVGCGELLTPPEVPELKANGGYFVGWSPDLTVMPDEDVVIEGAYSDTQCTVDIYVDGVLNTTERMRVGEKILLPEIPSREGEHFEWQNVPACAPEGHLEIHGGHIADPYTISYMMGETLLFKEEYRCGETIRPRMAPPQDGRGLFLGWEGMEETMPAHDLTVQAHFESRAYHVTFMIDDTVLHEENVAVGARIPLPEVPEREGYRFDGWRNYVEIMPSYSFTAYGSYSHQRYTVTFLCAGKKVDEREYVCGSAVIPPKPPKRAGAPFLSWEGLPKTMPARNLTVSAHYGGGTYRVSYLVDGELLFADQVEMGSRVVPHEAPARDGYAFLGWRDLPDFMPDRDVIVTGHYERRMYAVTYKADGIIWRVDRYDVGAAITPPDPPEHPHENFVGWRNFTSVMPDYDFICTAEYSETYGHYSFILDGEVVAEGKSRKGEMLTPPIPPHRSGFAFSGWDGFTGVMPAADVTYIGSYTPDTFKVRYMLDGELYHVDGYNEKEHIMPAEAPEREGYTFDGWQGLPKWMPADDVTVTGKMIPQKFRLIYKIDDRVIWDHPVSCGTKLGTVHAPDAHALSFRGWADEPEVMPAHPVTVSGSYAHSEPRYKTVTVGADRTEDVTVNKRYTTAPAALAFISGSYLRLIIDGTCYPVIGASDCVCNGRVTDEECLWRALRRTYRRYAIPKKKIRLIFNDSTPTDVAFEAPASSEAELSHTAEQLFGEENKGERLTYRHIELCECEDGNRYVMTSAVREETRKALETAFRRVGVAVSGADTLMGALTEYLQFNRRMVRSENQMCLFYLPTTVLGILLLDGQVSYLTQNALPYEDRHFDLEKETERAVRAMTAYAARRDVQGKFTVVVIGGIDRTHVRACEKLMPHLLRRLAKEDAVGLFSGKRYRRPEIVGLGFAMTENRTK